MKITKILELKYPETIWALNGDTYDGLQWLDESPKPTEAELLALWPVVEYETAHAEVERQRQQAYQAESDPLFFGWQRGENTEQAWLDKVQEIKDRYPYPEEPVK